jgi:hypothetical protein
MGLVDLSYCPLGYPYGLLDHPPCGEGLEIESRKREFYGE